MGLVAFVSVLRGIRKTCQDSPEHSLWKKELPRATMVGRSSIRWSCTTLELAPGPAKILSWAKSYPSPIPMGNTATPRVTEEQERVCVSLWPGGLKMRWPEATPSVCTEPHVFQTGHSHRPCEEGIQSINKR